MEPINYLAQVADPFAASLKGYASVDAILNADAKRAELARQQQLQQQQQQLAMQEQARFFTNPNPTMRDAARYASLLTPEQSKAFLPFMEGISKEKQQGILKSTGQTLSALQLNPEIGINKLKQDALAARNINDMSVANQNAVTSIVSTVLQNAPVEHTTTGPYSVEAKAGWRDIIQLLTTSGFQAEDDRADIRRKLQAIPKPQLDQIIQGISRMGGRSGSNPDNRPGFLGNVPRRRFRTGGGF